MSSQREDSIPHELRTAAEPRQNRLYTVQIWHIEQVNPTVRLLRLAFPSETQTKPEETEEPFTFLPGQWLDVHIPSIPQAGGFTITSTPADAQVLPSPGLPTDPTCEEEPDPPPINPQGRPPYVELAVQHSPASAPAAWLWRAREAILGKHLSVRVGGSFVWPPTGLDPNEITNVVFVAGGVGINPLISILSHLNNTSTAHRDIHFLYSSRLGPSTSLDQLLFLPRLRAIVASQRESHRLHISLELFLTDTPAGSLPASSPSSDLTIHHRRVSEADLRRVVSREGSVRAMDTVCYVCGPPAMTDGCVASLEQWLDERRVICEKWW
ncbi:hypothetical protein ASPZODRAFT_150220 [Penicilliopsis zonata CBS 506.65]|uniref:Oxidoreductase NAD-binding domain-containing protein 1 n=1 Tax=Penicilliopsis zonata CBS 506.65 TaxID=1073090 RepID=A0A1L9SQG4_9EURO|nr:hypothetical protein ASPZODRAFT_150220 [Penicilliopsis zonata CBS 506.65]OJJ49324.1 hypothetical protein ASPZODRAFT_150220 [Penicilliopsis zonata CBS 506.65]